MKTEVTINLEKAIRQVYRKIGVYGCFEVTIGICGKERVDFMTYDTKGIFRCFEIKCSKSDFYSSAKKSFYGHYNYYVMTKELYEQVKQDIPKGIGIYIYGECIVRPKKQKLSIDENILKDSMIRSLYRDSDKLYLAEKEQYVNRLKGDISKLNKTISEDSKRYNELFWDIRNYLKKESEEKYRDFRNYRKGKL